MIEINVGRQKKEVCQRKVKEQYAQAIILIALSHQAVWFNNMHARSAEVSFIHRTILRLGYTNQVPDWPIA